jgi:NAD(P)H dehydrogenase (quinone)
MKTLLVVAHPRMDSLTTSAANLFATRIKASGHDVEVADLVAEGFDPVLREDDEPNWSGPDKQYTAAVRDEMRRVERNDATVMIFPIWWWSMPAVLKGWIDRVWNHGWAYGGKTFPNRRAWMIGIAGSDAESYRKRGYDKAMEIQLKTGVLDYCGVADLRFEVLYGALEGDDAVAKILTDIQTIAAEY